MSAQRLNLDETAPVEITLDNVLPLLRAAVDTRGDDFTYRSRYSAAVSLSCQYLVNDQPACLIGVALALAGVELADVPNFSIGGLVETGRLPAGMKLDRRAVEVLAVAQSAQDDDATWGEAYAAAVQRHADVADRA